MARISDLRHEYYAARDAQNVRAEAATGGYATELAAYFGTDGEGDAVERRLTWKQWLIDHKSEQAPYREESTMVTATMPAAPGVNDAGWTFADTFRMSGAELASWAELGSAKAAQEIARRAANRAAKRQTRAAVR